MQEQPLSEPPGLDLDETVALSDGTQTTVRALRQRVVVLEPGIFELSEVEKPTLETLRVMSAKIEELSAGLEAFGILVDLSHSQGSTTGEYRRFIPSHFDDWTKRTKGALRQIAVPLETNAVVRVVAKFIVARIATAPFVISRSRDEALRGLREAIAQRS
jgi:hypothetical protein